MSCLSKSIVLAAAVAAAVANGIHPSAMWRARSEPTSESLAQPIERASRASGGKSVCQLSRGGRQDEARTNKFQAHVQLPRPRAPFCSRVAQRVRVRCQAPKRARAPLKHSPKPARDSMFGLGAVSQIRLPHGQPVARVAKRKKANRKAIGRRAAGPIWAPPLELKRIKLKGRPRFHVGGAYRVCLMSRFVKPPSIRPGAGMCVRLASIRVTRALNGLARPGRNVNPAARISRHANRAPWRSRSNRAPQVTCARRQANLDCVNSIWSPDSSAGRRRPAIAADESGEK